MVAVLFSEEDLCLAGMVRTIDEIFTQVDCAKSEMMERKKFGQLLGFW